MIVIFLYLLLIQINMSHNLLTIFGYGSLMDIDSAKSTIPTLTNFRQGALHGYTRRYNLVSINGLIQGWATVETNEMASLSVRPNNVNDVILGSLLEINESDLKPLLKREHRYKTVEVNCYEKNGDIIKALTFVEQSDQDYKNTMSIEEYHVRVGQYYTGSLWERNDILPLRRYMNKVIQAAEKLGGEVYVSNMLDETVLADGITTLRQYLQKYPHRKLYHISEFK